MITIEEIICAIRSLYKEDEFGLAEDIVKHLNSKGIRGNLVAMSYILSHQHHQN